MTHSLKKDKWAEDLPQECPPEGATNPQGKIFYRIIKNNPPIQEDFFSHRKLYPAKFFKVSECQARSTSIFDSLEACRRLLKNNRFKGCRITKLLLPPESGVILKTGQPGHFSWWRQKNFDPVDHCNEITKP